MDRFVRLIFVSLLLCLICLALVFWPSGDAHAFGEVQKQNRLKWTCTWSGAGATNPPTAYIGSSPEAACGAAVNRTIRDGSWSLVVTLTGCNAYNAASSSPATSCTYRETEYSNGKQSGSSNRVIGTSAVTEVTCPDGSDAIGPAGAGQKCVCSSGFRKGPGNTCEQYTCPPSGSYSAVTQPDQKVANAGDGQCSGGCAYTPSSWKVGADGQIWATWPFKSTGKFCRGVGQSGSPDVPSGEENTNSPAPVPCGTNQCPGTVNGATICVPCKGQQEQGPSTSASAPAGSASGAGGGSSTKTECNGINCTTTTTTTDAAGNVTGTAEKTEKQESFCKENPTSSLCKQSSFGGSCAATTCEGDAVMCAIAADQYKRNCEWFDDPASAQLATVGNAAINGLSRPDGHPANAPDAQSVSFSSVIDQTDRLGGSCPADVSVTVAGRSVVMPLSSMCGNLQLIGNLMVGFCMFVAALIVFRN